MKQTVRLTESELKEMVMNAINEQLNEAEDEMRIKNLPNNVKSGWSRFKKGMAGSSEGKPIKKFMSSVKAGVDTAKNNDEWHNLEDLRMDIKNVCTKYNIDQEMPVRQLIAPGGPLGKAKANITRGIHADGGERFEESINAVVDKVINEMLQR